MTPRAPEDDDGRMLDAADRLYEQLEREAAGLGEANAKLPPLLHMLVMTWIDRLADAGQAERHGREVGAITTAMAKIAGRADVIRWGVS